MAEKSPFDMSAFAAGNPALASAFNRLRTALGATTAEGLAVRPVTTVAIDPMTGNPVSSGGATRTTSGTAGVVPMPPGVVPASVQPRTTRPPTPGPTATQRAAINDTSRLAVPGNVINPSGVKVADGIVTGKNQDRLPSLMAFNGGSVAPPVAAITNALRPPAANGLTARPPITTQPRPGATITLAQINQRSRAVAPQPNLRAPLPYDPRVDVSGSKQSGAGGWGINAGGGIVA